MQRVHWPLFIGVWVFVASFAHAQDNPSFQSALQGQQAKYFESFQDLEAKCLQAKLDELLQEAKQLVPDSQKSPADYRILGTMFFVFDKEASLAFNKKAFETEKKDPNLIFDLALLYHGSGAYQKALDHYGMLEKHLSAPNHALLADCYLNLNLPKQALAAWQKADFGENHVAIDRNIWMVYGDIHPFMQRQKLINAIRKNGPDQQDKLIELLALGLDWQESWWEGGPNAEVLNYDRKMFEKEISEENKQAMLTLVDLGTGALDAEDLEAKLHADGLLVRDGQLPANSKLVRLLLNFMVEVSAKKKNTIVEKHLKALELRAKSQGGDHEAMLILANYFANQNPESLREWNQLGWEKYSDHKFLASWLIAELDTLTPNDERLTHALKTFPDEPIFWQIKYTAAKTANTLEKRDMLASWAMAEFKGLKSSPERYAHGLNEIFNMLEKTF